MAICSDRKSSRRLWCTLVIATIATCCAFVYISFSAETKQSSPLHSSKGYSSSPEKLTESKCISVCDSKECVYRTKILLDYMKPDVNPCENFYQFICGKFLENHVPEEGGTYITRYPKMMAVELKNVLESIEADPGSASGKMKAVYNSCLKYSSSDLQSIPTILQFLNKLGIPDWPNLGSDFKFDTNLTRVIGNFLIYDQYGFAEFAAKGEYRDPDDPNPLPVNTTLYPFFTIFQNLEKPVRKYVVDRILNYFIPDSETIDEMWEEFEAVLGAILSLKKESRRIDDEIEELTGESPDSFLDCTPEIKNEWKDLCELLDMLMDVSGRSEKVSSNYGLIGGSRVYYMQNIFPLIRNFTDRSIANFLALNVFLDNMNELNLYFRLTSDKIAAMHRPDKHESSNRWQSCVEWISQHMPLALGYEYLKKSFTVPMIQEMAGLALEGIRETAEYIYHQEWMSEDLRKILTEEIGNTTIALELQLSILPNETKVNGFYEEFHPTDENFLHNVLEYKKYLKILEMRRVVTDATTSWLTTLFNPFAQARQDEVEIQLGLLLPPTYMHGLQRYLNLISLGMVMVHETGHIFEGRFLYQSKSISDTEALTYFEEKKKCLEDQYSQFRFESIGKNMRGAQVYKENFCDTFAVSVLDKLIKKYASNDTTLLLPSLSFSSEQLMYISGFQMWCSSHTEKQDEEEYKFSTHSPNRFRILGMMQNSKGFSEAFGCSNGSYMNPFPKCLLLE